MRNKNFREIVINTEYGGFGLSPVAKIKYWQRKGLRPVLYLFDSEHQNKTYISLAEAELVHNTYGVCDVFCEDEDGHLLLSHDIPRDDPDLIAVVKELGPEKAGDGLSKLKIVEIPADIKWQIEEYDGKEWVAEWHRTWD